MYRRKPLIFKNIFIIEANFFDVVLSGNEFTKDDAIAWAMGYDWGYDCECKKQRISHLNYIDTVNGIDIYYCYGTDDYYFADALF